MAGSMTADLDRQQRNSFEFEAGGVDDADRHLTGRQLLGEWFRAAIRFLEPDVASTDASGKRNIRGIAPNRWSPRPRVM
jgi:hypothetical protein